MSGWDVAALVMLGACVVVLFLWINLREALFDLAELEQRLMQEGVRASMWQQQCEYAEEEIGRLQAILWAPAFTAADMAFLSGEASRLRDSED